MRVAAAHDHSDPIITSYLEAMEKAKNAVRFSGGFFRIFWYVCQLVYQCKKVRKVITKIIGKCTHSCDRNMECAQYFCDTAKTLRNGFVDIDRKLPNSFLFRPLKSIIQKPIEDWDDFVVDCEISSDKEIHSLIAQISDAI